MLCKSTLNDNLHGNHFKRIWTRTSTDFYYEQSCDYYLFKFTQINKKIKETRALFYTENKVN